MRGNMTSTHCTNSQLVTQSQDESTRSATTTKRKHDEAGTSEEQFSTSKRRDEQGTNMREFENGKIVNNFASISLYLFCIFFVYFYGFMFILVF